MYARMHCFRVMCTATPGDGNDVFMEICARQEVICACQGRRQGLVASHKTCALVQHSSSRGKCVFILARTV